MQASTTTRHSYGTVLETTFGYGYKAYNSSGLQSETYLSYVHRQRHHIIENTELEPLSNRFSQAIHVSETSIAPGEVMLRVTW